MSLRRFLLSYYGDKQSTLDQDEEKTSLIQEGRLCFDNLREFSFWRALLAEFIALVLFIPLAMGPSAPWLVPNTPTVVQIALANGFMISTLIQCFAAASGAHFNPAVSLPLALFRQISLIRCVLYIVAQCAGACLGAAILKQVTPASVVEDYNNTLGCTLLGADVTSGQGFLVEFVITFQLVLTIFATIDTSRQDIKGSGAVAIGLSVTCGVLFSIPYTGASMNPARSFGPAVVQGNFTDHWIYWLAPLLGGIVAACVYKWIFGTNSRRADMVV